MCWGRCQADLGHQCPGKGIGYTLVTCLDTLNRDRSIAGWPQGSGFFQQLWLGVFHISPCCVCTSPLSGINVSRDLSETLGVPKAGLCPLGCNMGSSAALCSQCCNHFVSAAMNWEEGNCPLKMLTSPWELRGYEGGLAALGMPHL